MIDSAEQTNQYQTDQSLHCLTFGRITALLHQTVLKTTTVFNLRVLICLNFHGHSQNAGIYKSAGISFYSL